MQLFLGLSRGSSTRLDSSSHSLSFFFVLRQKRFHFFYVFVIFSFCHIIYFDHGVKCGVQPWRWIQCTGSANVCGCTIIQRYRRPWTQRTRSAVFIFWTRGSLAPLTWESIVGGTWVFSPAGCDSSLTLTFAVNTDCLRGLKACAGVQGPGLCYTTVSRC